MFDFASMHIQKLSLDYLEEAKRQVAQMVVSHVRENTLFDPKKVDAIYNRNDFKNMLKRSCAMFQVQLSSHLTDDCENISKKGRTLLMKKASALSFTHVRCQESEVLTPDLLNLCSLMGPDGQVVNVPSQYEHEFKNVMSTLRNVVRIEYQGISQAQVSYFLKQMDAYLNTLNLDNLSKKPD